MEVVEWEKFGGCQMYVRCMSGKSDVCQVSQVSQVSHRGDCRLLMIYDIVPIVPIY